MAVKVKYQNIKNGKPYEPPSYERCCDCGLVHRVRTKAVDRKTGRAIKNAKILFTVWRDDEQTALERKKIKIHFGS